MKETGFDNLEIFQPLKMANNDKIKKCLLYNNQFQSPKGKHTEDEAKEVAIKTFVKTAKKL